MTYVIIVTYGDRKQFLEQILFFFNTYTSLQLVIINNNSEYSVNEINLVLNNPNVFIINSAVNKGSAWGYKTGIQYACNQQNCEMIWLLDDDNLPETNTLEILQSQYEHLQSHSNFKHFALMPFRTDRSYLSNVIQGEPIKWNFPQKNAFLGFHIFKLHFKLVKKLNLLKRKSHSSNFVIPCAPYGGFFFHKDLIKLIGLPDERFFVYADDFEFTYRITEEKITGAEEKILKIEGELYEALLNELFDYLAPVQTNGNLLAIMDCLCCFAHNAIQYQYNLETYQRKTSLLP